MLSTHFQVVAWDLPGHGRGAPATEAFTMAELAEGVLTLVDEVLAERGEPGGSFAYAGVSAGGAVGLQLLVDHPGRVGSATLLCNGSNGSAHRRAGPSVPLSCAPVGTSGRRGGVRPPAGSRPASSNARPAVASGSAHVALRTPTDSSYAWVCEALAGFDLRGSARRDRRSRAGCPREPSDDPYSCRVPPGGR